MPLQSARDYKSCKHFSPYNFSVCAVICSLNAPFKNISNKITFSHFWIIKTVKFKCVNMRDNHQRVKEQVVTERCESSVEFNVLVN